MSSVAAVAAGGTCRDDEDEDEHADEDDEDDEDKDDEELEPLEAEPFDELDISGGEGSGRNADVLGRVPE